MRPQLRKSTAAPNRMSVANGGGVTTMTAAEKRKRMIEAGKKFNKVCFTPTDKDSEKFVRGSKAFSERQAPVTGRVSMRQRTRQSLFPNGLNPLEVARQAAREAAQTKETDSVPLPVITEANDANAEENRDEPSRSRKTPGKCVRFADPREGGEEFVAVKSPPAATEVKISFCEIVSSESLMEHIKELSDDQLKLLLVTAHQVEKERLEQKQAVPKADNVLNVENARGARRRLIATPDASEVVDSADGSALRPLGSQRRSRRTQSKILLSEAIFMRYLNEGCAHRDVSQLSEQAPATPSSVRPPCSPDV